jgi:hypothetical protein
MWPSIHSATADHSVHGEVKAGRVVCRGIRIEACDYDDVSFDTLRQGGPLSPRGGKSRLSSMPWPSVHSATADHSVHGEVKAG